MLGITVPDAIALGSLVAGLVAMWRGATAGAQAAKVTPPNPAVAALAGTFITTDAMDKLTAALREIAHEIREGREHKERHDFHRLTEAMEKLVRKLEHKD